MQKVSRKLLFMAAILLVAAFVNVQLVSANNGSIKTVSGSCGSPVVNANHYVSGDPVFIKGENFDPGDYDWDITHQSAPGNPKPVITSGVFPVDQSGAFCFQAHVIGALESGAYQATFGNKSDGYLVKQVVTPEEPVEPEDPGEPKPTAPPPVASVPSQPVAQSTPAPVVAPTTGASSGPAALVISAVSALGLSGLSLGAWLKRRKI